MSTITEEIFRAEPATVDLPDPTLTGQDVLLLAADYMEEHGRCVHSMEDRKGRVCALGAISAASGSDYMSDEDDEHTDVYYEAKTLFAAYLREHEGSTDIATWNDFEVTSGIFGWRGKRTVVRALREAGRCA